MTGVEMDRYRTDVAALCRRHGVRRLDLFGSAAAGRDRPGESDLDFLVEFDAHPPGGYADAYFCISPGSIRRNVNLDCF